MTDDYKHVNQAILLAKIEVTYGTDPSPVGANAVLCTQPQIKILADKEERKFVSPTISPLAPQYVGCTQEVNFQVEARTSNAAGTAPEIGPLLRACGFKQTVVESTSVTYELVSKDMESCAIYVYFGGTLHKLLGARGNVKFIGGTNKYGLFDFTMRAVYAGRTAVTAPTPVYDTRLPEIVKHATVSLTPEGGSAFIPVMTTLEWDLKNEIFVRQDVTQTEGIKEIVIAGRAPSGTFDPEMPTLTTKDFWDEFKSRTASAMVFGYGVAGADSKIQFNCPKVVYDPPEYQNRGPVLAHKIPFTCEYDEGDDELKITYK